MWGLDQAGFLCRGGSRCQRQRRSGAAAAAAASAIHPPLSVNLRTCAGRRKESASNPLTLLVRAMLQSCRYRTRSESPVIKLCVPPVERVSVRKRNAKQYNNKIVAGTTRSRQGAVLTYASSPRSAALGRAAAPQFGSPCPTVGRALQPGPFDLAHGVSQSTRSATCRRHPLAAREALPACCPGRAARPQQQTLRSWPQQAQGPWCG